MDLSSGVRTRGRRSRSVYPSGFTRLLSLALAAVLLTSCATAPPPHSPPWDDAPDFSSTDGVELAPRWWESFGDSVLTTHVERGLAENFTLRVAFERLSAARAVAKQEGAARSPLVDAVAGATLFDGDGDEPDDDYRVGLEASYELDLWGRIRANIEAERLEAEATAEDYRAAAVILSAEIALAVYRVTEARAQLALIASQLETNRDVLEVIERRFAVGQSGSADVLRQRQLVEATVEQRITEAAILELLEHQLAVLEGDAPQGTALVDVPAALPALPSIPAIGLPADLLERRPDLRAALWRLESADASIAAAVRDQYPRIDLAASIFTTAEKPADLFSNWIGSLAGQIVAPLVDGRRRRLEVERTVAERRQRLAEYGATVLTAFREVEDALAQERHESTRIASIEKQVELARTTYAELRNQYLNGAADFIDVLVSLRDQQTLERDLLRARLLRIEYRISLHRAIAGGFADTTEESTEETTGDSTKGTP